QPRESCGAVIHLRSVLAILQDVTARGRFFPSWDRAPACPRRDPWRRARCRAHRGSSQSPASRNAFPSDNCSLEAQVWPSWVWSFAGDFAATSALEVWGSALSSDGNRAGFGASVAGAFAFDSPRFTGRFASDGVLVIGFPFSSS